MESASPSVFSGFTFYLPSGSIAKTNSKTLSSLVTKHFGIWSSAFTEKITHVIVDENELILRVPQVIKALQKKCIVVTETWLRHMVKYNKVPLSPPLTSFIYPETPENYSPTSLITITRLSLILPQCGPMGGNFKVAVFGNGFVNCPDFKIRVGVVDAIDYQFHGSTAVLATIPECLLAPGDTLTAVSNDSGRTWSSPLLFTVFDPKVSTPPLPTPASLKLSQELSLSSEISVSSIPKDSITDLSSDLSTPIPSFVKTIDREIRLFISSPFLDMQQERDLIVKSVIPKLRKMCMERDIAFSYVDLRWGLTNSQTETATTLLMCLREIESCNIMIGLFGERYGWCISPERDPKQNELLRRGLSTASKEFPWVSDMANLSISEIEMRMVLDQKYRRQFGEDKSSWFYLRDPYYIEEVPEKEKSLYKTESEASHKQLQTFKKYLTSHARPSPRNYVRPVDVTELIFEDIRAHIDREFPITKQLSTLERERFRHKVYARAFCGSYLPNENNFNKLDLFVSTPGNTPLVISGVPGIGKSALLANWAVRHIQHTPEDIVIQHCVGCSPASSNAGQLLSRILLELYDKLEISDESLLPRDSDQASVNSIAGMGLNLSKVLKEFSNSLKLMNSKYNSNKRRIILIIDGLDKIDSRENAHDLIWLPHRFPKSVRVMISCSPSFAGEVLAKRRGIEFLEIKSLGEADRKAFIRAYLTKKSKRLSEKQEFTLAQSSQTSLPLYLKTLLDDLSEFGQFDQLDQKIQTDLKCQNTSELYDIVLARLETNMQASSKVVSQNENAGYTWVSPLANFAAMAASNLSKISTQQSNGDAGPVKMPQTIPGIFLSLLWGSRRGLMLHSELDQILTVQHNISETRWMEFFVIADETLLADCSGLLLFANEDVRRAVLNRYIPTRSQQKAIHVELAQFFKKIPDLTDRKVEELPYHLAESEQWGLLRDCLCDLAMFDKLYTNEANKYDLTKNWLLLEKQGMDVVESYKNVVNRGLFPTDLIVGDLIFHLGRFLLDMDKAQGAEFMFQKAQAYYQQASQMINVGKVYCSLGELFLAQIRYDEAEQVLLKTVKIYESELGEDNKSLAHALDRLGVVYTSQSKYSLAKDTLNRALNISNKVNGSQSTQSANVNYDIACLLLTTAVQDDISQAEQLLLKALEVKEKILGPWDIEVSHVLLRLGALYLEQNQFRDAEECLDRSRIIRETKLGPDHSRVAQCLRHLITCYEMQELYPKALETGLKALEIAKKVYGESNLGTAGILLRIGTLHLTADPGPQGCILSRPYVLGAMTIRKAKYPPGHKCIEECQKVLDSIDASSKPRVVPPPPPPHGGRIPEPPQKSIKPVLAQKPVIMFDPKGVPPPPPPPLPAKATVCVQATQQAEANTLEMLQNFSIESQLQRTSHQNADRSDGHKAAAAMIGANARRIHFKKALY